MHYVGGGLVPSTPAEAMAATALAASAVNIGGGFHVTRAMLALFRRPGDPDDHVGYFTIPGTALIAGTWAGQAAGLPGITPAAYLASSVLCVAAIACLSRQDTARLGNALGIAGVAGGVAAAAGALDADAATLAQVAGLLAAGGGVGLAIARGMATTDLPQTVAGFHALVGGAAVLTSVAAALAGGAPDALHTAATVAGTVIGAVTLTGSAVAYGKLSGRLPSAALALPGKNAINAALAGLTGAAGAAAFSAGDAAGVAASLAAATAAAGALGAHSTASIGGERMVERGSRGWRGGRRDKFFFSLFFTRHFTATPTGADMPVVVTLLNSYSGYALCAEGFLMGNDLLTSVGALIGASGGILSYIMCVAMNRSLANVVFGGYAVKAKGPKAAPTGDEREAAITDVATVADMLAHAKDVVIVPGYGMAVAGASGDVAALAHALRSSGARVRFAIHPVAGRMPGQLNVLLAESRVPYDWVHEMEDVNPDMASADVALVVGANDTVNSAAVEDPDSSLYGMPVIEAWKAKQCVVLKRTLGAGYAGADNPVFTKASWRRCAGWARGWRGPKPQPSRTTPPHATPGGHPHAAGRRQDCVRPAGGQRAGAAGRVRRRRESRRGGGGGGRPTATPRPHAVATTVPRNSPPPARPPWARRIAPPRPRSLPRPPRRQPKSRKRTASAKRPRPRTRR